MLFIFYFFSFIFIHDWGYATWAMSCESEKYFIFSIINNKIRKCIHFWKVLIWNLDIFCLYTNFYFHSVKDKKAFHSGLMMTTIIIIIVCFHWNDSGKCSWNGIASEPIVMSCGNAEHSMFQIKSFPDLGQNLKSSHFHQPFPAI